MSLNKILAVGEETSFIEVVQKAAEISSWKLTLASDRVEGLEKAYNERPDLIVLGYIEPRGEAFQLHEELKGNPETSNIPLLVVDVPQEEHLSKGWRRDEGLRINAEGYLRQPTEPLELAQCVEKILSKEKVLVTA